jgi:site-specific DNA recombinase
MASQDVIYARLSQDKTGAGLGIDRQVREVIEHFDLPPDTPVYADNDLSATNGKPRPGYLRLIADMTAGAVTRVNVWHTDRLWRRPRELEDFIDVAERRGVVTRAKQAGLADLSTPGGRTMVRIGVAIAKGEVDVKGERQKAANRQRAQAGHIGWTRRPYGYDKRAGRIVVVEAEADVIRAAAVRVLAGASTSSVCKDLNDRGVPTTGGGEWSPTTLRRILTNPRTAGRAVLLGEDFGRGDWPAILDQDTADRLAALYTGLNRRTAPPTVHVKYLLSGMARCGLCGEPVYARPVKDGPMVYRCRTAHLARRLDLVDEVVEATVVGRLAQPDAVDLLAPDADLDALRAQATELRDRRDGLASLLADGLMSAAATRESASKLTAAISTIERQMTAATPGPLTSLLGADDVAKHWASLTLLAKRDVINVLMTVTIKPAGKGKRFDPDDVDVTWRQS